MQPRWVPLGRCLRYNWSRQRERWQSSSAAEAATVATTSAKKRETFIERIQGGPGLSDFFTVKPASKIKLNENDISEGAEGNNVPYLSAIDYNGQGRRVYFEVYGCQMNTNDTEVVWSILQQHGYVRSKELVQADVVMLVTCAVRDGAEQKIWNRLRHLRALKERRGSSSKRRPLQLTLLGCMAERLKERLLEQEQCVDVIAGPDSYKDLPRLLAIARHYGNSAINVLLSLDETYADVMPVRLSTDSPTAFVSIMRGCDNMCTYCIVPFTRGRERSRPLESIVREVQTLQQQGVKEVTLLGQNVNSYRDRSGTHDAVKGSAVPGFKTVYKPKTGGVPFAALLQSVAEAVPEMRIRFTSPHPKDFSDEVLHVIRDYPNVCKQLHLPAQSGNTAVLDRMRRGYTREAYLQLVERIRDILPNVALSSDFICGFCGETETEFEDTISLIERVRYNVAYLFAYSMREKTTAHRRYVDDVPVGVKRQRLQRMVHAFRHGATELHKRYEGQDQLILIEGKSKRSDSHWFGRNDANIKVIVPASAVPLEGSGNGFKDIDVGDFVITRIDESNSQVLKGTPLQISSLSCYQPK